MAYGTKNFDNFIPELWSARLLQNLDKTFVYPQCVNRDYENEISGGMFPELSIDSKQFLEDYFNIDLTI